MNATLHRHARPRTLLESTPDSGGDDGSDRLLSFIGSLLLKVSQRGPLIASALRQDIAAVVAELSEGNTR